MNSLYGIFNKVLNFIIFDKTIVDSSRQTVRVWTVLFAADEKFSILRLYV